jgi:nucleotidyltransferase-like protein
MGKVYTVEQIGNHQIPSAGAHELAGQFILDELTGINLGERGEGQLFTYPDNGVKSAMVYGSTAYGTAGIRSDLDVLVVVNPERAIEASEAVATTFAEAKARYKVSIEHNPSEDGMIYFNQEHGFDPLFVSHLLEIRDLYGDRWCRNNPTAGFERVAEQANDPWIVNAVAYGYVSGRRNVFLKAMTDAKIFSEAIDYDAFQRALELPSAIGRKVVAATAEEGDEPLDLSSRPSMQQRARTALLCELDERDDELFARYDHLYGLDHEYSLLLADAIAGDISFADYQQWVAGHYKEAVEIAFTISKAWVMIFRRRANEMSHLAVSSSVQIAGFNDRSGYLLPGINKEYNYN